VRKGFLIPAVVLLIAALLAAWWWRDTSQPELDKLAAILDWRPGRIIAEIGAGKGKMTVSAAERVGPSGHVFSTELDPGRLAEIRALVKERKLTNVTVIKAGDTDSNLPAGCCDAVFMRDVYHHFTHPDEINMSLFQALKPGGLLAIVDFPPGKVLSFVAPVGGVPKNRVGHGIQRAVLIDELSGAGFHVDTIPVDWPGHNYCVIFRKPR
jgi:SAM-dependent methyltransferase